MMNKSRAVAYLLTVTIIMLILPTAQAVDIDLSETCSLADAITAANTDTAVGDCPAGDGADTISLSGDITLTATLPHITSEITIDGGGFTISGRNRVRIFAVNGGTFTVNELTMTRGKADWGGAIVNVNGGTVSINDSAVTRNEAAEGGAIGNEAALTISNTVVNQNTAKQGGAIHSLSGRLAITNSSVSANSTDQATGGAIYVQKGTLMITESVFRDNSAGKKSGGAIHFEEGNLTIHRTAFIGNAAHYGGAILFDSGTMKMDEVIVQVNTAQYGGGVYLGYDAILHMNNGQFLSNIARFSGGGIYTRNGAERIKDSLFSENRAKNGGAIALDSGQMVVSESSFWSNVADEEGGAIRNGSSNPFRGSLTVTNGSFSFNKAVEGGAIYVQDKRSATLIHLHIVENGASASGGGLYRDPGAEVHIYNSLIARNVAGDCFGRMNTNVRNLIEDGSCFPALIGDPMLQDIVEPKDSGRLFFPLEAGSPAIDAADALFCPDTDIIGTPRPQGAACDIGAFEYIGSESD